MVYSVPILIPVPPFVEKPYTTPFIDAQRIPLGSNMYIKAYFLSRMKIRTVNSKIKHKSKTMLGVIRNLILDFILYFVTAYMRKYPMCRVTSVQGKAQNTLYITWTSKKYFITNNLLQQLHTTIFQNYYNEKWQSQHIM